MSFSLKYVWRKTVRHERRKFRLSELPVGILAGAFVAIATTGAQAEPVRIAASPASADPVQLVPVEVEEPASVALQAVASAQPKTEEPASAEPQVAQSDEDDAKAEAEQEPEAFPSETLTDRAGVETLSDVVRYAVLNHPAVKRAIAEKNNAEFAVDEEYAEPGTVLREGQEVAVMPPVQGG